MSQAGRRSKISKSACVLLFLLVLSVILLSRVIDIDKYLKETLSFKDAEKHFSKPQDSSRFRSSETARPGLHPPVYELDQLEQRRFPHGTFFFGPHSQEIEIDSTYKPLLNDIQKLLLDDDNDDNIDIDLERERCARYNFGLANETHPKRRRLFLGSLLADDSIEVIKAVGTEAYNIFHTVSFIEGNTTQNLTPRKWKYYDPELPPDNLNKLYQLFGPKTKVSVDYYVTTLKDIRGDALMPEFLQREGNIHRWTLNGMKEDDVGMVLDADEIFSRDFLRAMQICDVPEFQADQNCHKPKLIASTMVMESSPNCITKNRRWHHPDAILGSCIDQVGNSILHPPTKRGWKDTHGLRSRGYGHGFDYSKYGHNGTYPLWNAPDFRMEEGGQMREMADGSPTGYHFHNFFNSAEEIHVKYRTYGHPIDDAMEKPIWDLSSDLATSVDCAHGTSNEALDFNNSGSSVLPIYFMNEEIRTERHQLWQNIVKDEQEWWNKRSNNGQEADNAVDEGNASTEDHAFSNTPNHDKQSNSGQEADNAADESKALADDHTFSNNPSKDERVSTPLSSTSSDWDSSRSAVLGLATGLHLEDYKNFVGSLRSTGYPGHIILGIARNAPNNVVSFLSDQNVTMKFIDMAEKCTYDGSIGHDGVPGKVLDTSSWHCPKAYPDYKITWARFPIYKDWLNECPSCTDGVVLTDVRDAYFQRDPFATAVKLQMQYPLMVFEEIYPELDNTHWLTEFPVKMCKNFTVGNTPMLCSGSIMGSREGIIDYIDSMVGEFDFWKEQENCRINMPGDDQSIHNYMYYANRLKNAVAIPHRTGPLHVIGWQAARIWESATEEGKELGKQGDTGLANFYVNFDKWQDWLPKKYGLLDPETGLVLNKDGSPSAQAHQVDRFGSLNQKWLAKMNEENWPYNKE